MAVVEAPSVRIDELRRRRGADAKGQIFLGLLSLAVLLAIALVGSVLWSVLADSWSLLVDRLGDFLS